MKSILVAIVLVASATSTRAAELQRPLRIPGSPLDPVANHAAAAYVGTGYRTVIGDDFYEAVGRPDLADSYRLRMAGKSALAATGVAVMLAVILFPSGASDGGGDTSCVGANLGPAAGMGCAAGAPLI